MTSVSPKKLKCIFGLLLSDWKSHIKYLTLLNSQVKEVFGGFCSYSTFEVIFTLHSYEVLIVKKKTVLSRGRIRLHGKKKWQTTEAHLVIIVEANSREKPHTACWPVMQVHFEEVE